MTLKAKVIRNIGANAYGQIITVTIQLASVPLFLHYWGVELYGEWLILSAIPAYLSLSDVGFTTVAANDMTMRVAKGDQQGALVVYQSIWIFITAVTLLVGIVLGYLIFSFSVNELFSISHISSGQTPQILLVLMLYSILGVHSGLLSSGFRAVGRYAYGIVMSNSIRLVEWLLSMLMLVISGNALYMAMALLIVRFFGLLALWLVLRVQAPWLNLGYNSASVQKVRELTKPAFAFTVFPLGFALSIQGMVLVIGMLLGPVAVTIFSAYRTLSRVLVQVTAMFYQSLSPEISAAYATGKMDIVFQLHRRGSSVIFWLALASIVIYGLVGEWVIGVWTHHTFESNHLLFSLLIATVFLNVLWQASGIVLMSTNFHQRISTTFLGTTVGGVLISILLIKQIGINGAGLALVIAELPMMYLTISHGLALLNDNWAGYSRAVIGNPFQKKVR